MADSSAPHRRAPLVAAGRASTAPGPRTAPDGRADDAEVDARPDRRRTPGGALALGLATALGTGALLYGLCAGPIYILAQIATDGLDRPMFRNALLGALVLSAVLGAAIGAAVGIWFLRGGRLPSDRRSFSDR